MLGSLAGADAAAAGVDAEADEAGDDEVPGEAEGGFELAGVVGRSAFLLPGGRPGPRFGGSAGFVPVSVTVTVPTGTILASVCGTPGG